MVRQRAEPSDTLEGLQSAEIAARCDAVVRCLSVTFAYCVETDKNSCYGMRIGKDTKLSNGTIFNVLE